MKNPKLIHKKRLKRRKVAAKHLAHERYQGYLLRLPKAIRIKVLKQRIAAARAKKQYERDLKKAKADKIKNLFK